MSVGIRSRVLFATVLLVCGVAGPVAAQAPVQEGLSDERVMELAREYVELLYHGEYDPLWQHVSPAAQERFGTLERVRSAGMGGTPVRLTIGPVNDGTIGGIAARPVR